LRNNYIQTVFKIGFDQLVRLREEADRLAHIRGADVSMLDENDQEFVTALRRFKPLVVEEGRLRNFQSIADVERARARLDQLFRMVETFVRVMPGVRQSFRKTFNTAAVQFVVNAKFEPVPLRTAELESFISKGFELPRLDLPDSILPYADIWW